MKIFGHVLMCFRLLEILVCRGEWRKLTISKFTLLPKWRWRTNKWPTLSGLLRWKDERLNRLWRWQHTEDNCCFPCVVVWYGRDKHRTNFFGTETCRFGILIWSVLCDLCYCISISAFWQYGTEYLVETDPVAINSM